MGGNINQNGPCIHICRARPGRTGPNELRRRIGNVGPIGREGKSGENFNVGPKSGEPGRSVSTGLPGLSALVPSKTNLPHVTGGVIP